MSASEIVRRSAAVAAPDFDRDFCRLAQRVRPEPYRTGLLPPDLISRFMRLRSPAAKEFFLALRGREPVGSLAANISAADPGVGFLGFFEVDLQRDTATRTALALLAEAEEWLRKRGARFIYGPVNFSTWFPYRYRIDGSDGRSFAWEPVNPPEYVLFLRRFGMLEVQRYRSTCNADLDLLEESTRPAYAKCVAEGFRFRPFRAEAAIGSDLGVIHALSTLGFADSFLFEPIAPDDFRDLYVPMLAGRDNSPSHIVEDAEGRPVGFFFIFADAGHMVLKSTAVHPDCRGRGLFNALIHLGARKARERGLRTSVAALVRSGAPSESCTRKSKILWRHEYALFGRRIG